MSYKRSFNYSPQHQIDRLGASLELSHPIESDPIRIVPAIRRPPADAEVYPISDELASRLFWNPSKDKMYNSIHDNLEGRVIRGIGWTPSEGHVFRSGRVFRGGDVVEENRDSNLREDWEDNPTPERLPDDWFCVMFYVHESLYIGQNANEQLTTGDFSEYFDRVLDTISSNPLSPQGALQWKKLGADVGSIAGAAAGGAVGGFAGAAVGGAAATMKVLARRVGLPNLLKRAMDVNCNDQNVRYRKEVRRVIAVHLGGRGTDWSDGAADNPYCFNCPTGITESGLGGLPGNVKWKVSAFAGPKADGVSDDTMKDFQRRGPVGDLAGVYPCDNYPVGDSWPGEQPGGAGQPGTPLAGIAGPDGITERYPPENKEPGEGAHGLFFRRTYFYQTCVRGKDAQRITAPELDDDGNEFDDLPVVARWTGGIGGCHHGHGADGGNERAEKIYKALMDCLCESVRKNGQSDANGNPYLPSDVNVGGTDDNYGTDNNFPGNGLGSVNDCLDAIGELFSGEDSILLNGAWADGDIATDDADLDATDGDPNNSNAGSEIANIKELLELLCGDLGTSFFDSSMAYLNDLIALARDEGLEFIIGDSLEWLFDPNNKRTVFKELVNSCNAKLLDDLLSGQGCPLPCTQ